MVEEVDMSNGTIMEALNNKADIDLNNLSVEDKRALIEENKETIMGWMIPDYSKGISISNDYVCEKDGYVVQISSGSGNDAVAQLYVDGILVSTTVTRAPYNQEATASAFVSKGSVVTYVATKFNSITFYPLKGAN